MILRKGKGMKGKDLSSRREIEERREEKDEKEKEEEEDEKGCALLQSKGGWMVSTLSVLLCFSLSLSPSFLVSGFVSVSYCLSFFSPPSPSLHLQDTTRCFRLFPLLRPSSNCDSSHSFISPYGTELTAK